MVSLLSFRVFPVKDFCDNIQLPHTLQMIAVPLSFSGVARVFQIPVTQRPLTICYYHLNEKSLDERQLSGYHLVQGYKLIILLPPPILSNSDKPRVLADTNRCISAISIVLPLFT